jgi:hypothetical protein
MKKADHIPRGERTYPPQCLVPVVTEDLDETRGHTQQAQSKEDHQPVGEGHSPHPGPAGQATIARMW